MRSAITVLVAVVIASLSAGTALGATVVTLTPAQGHPLLPVTISGTGFGNSEAVDVFIDTVDTLLLVSSATGTLTGSVTIPASAKPGTHFITAIGRRSGDAAQLAFNVTTPWLEFGFGAAHQGANPYENTVDVTNVGSLGLLWSGAGPGSGAVPVIASGRVIATGQPGIQALSAATGKVVWSKLPGDFFDASPAVLANVIYVGSLSGNVYALNASTGATIWTTRVGGEVYSSATVANNVVYVGTLTNVLYALQTSTGAVLWSFTTGSFIDSTPAVVNGTVYFGSADGKVYALDATTGAVQWTYTTGGSVEGSPTVVNGIVFIGSDDDKVYAIRAAGPHTGQLLWSYTTGGSVYSAPAFGYGLVFVGVSDAKLYALNARTGALQWSVTAADTVGTPAVANGVVYATSRDGSLNAFAAPYGGLLFSAFSGAPFLGGPAISDGVLYVNGYGDKISAYSLFAGTSAARAVAKPPSIASVQPDFSLAVTRYAQPSQSAH